MTEPFLSFNFTVVQERVKANCAITSVKTCLNSSLFCCVYLCKINMVTLYDFKLYTGELGRLQNK